MAGAIAEAFVRVHAIYDTASFRKGADQVVKGNQQLSRSLKQGEQDFGRFARGAAVGSGAVHGLGRSVAFASASFLGAYGFVSVLRTSIETAEKFEKASRGLDAQLKATGLSSSGAAPLIAKTNTQMAALGITANESELALTRLIRATGDTAKAAKLMGLVADFAAARHIRLGQAALVTGKVVQGTVTAFNRFGLVIQKGTSVTEALTRAQKVFAGQAEANVTPLEKLHASVTNLEAAIGVQLLPTVNKIADSLNKWLSNSANQERIQRDVSRAVKDGTQIVDGFAQALRLANGILENTVGKVLSLKHAVELLVLVMVVKKIDAFAASLGLVGTSAAVATTPVAVLGTTAATTATEMAVLSKSIGTGAAGKLGFAAAATSGATAATKMGTAMRVGIAAGAIVAGVQVSELIRKIPGWESTFRRFGGFLEGIFGGGSGQGPTPPPGLEARLRARVAKELAQGGGDYAAFGNPLALAGFDVSQPTGAPGAEASSITGLRGQDAAKRAALVTREQATATALARAQAEGTRAQITAAVNARLSYLRDTVAFAKRLIASGRGNTKQLEQTLQSLYGEEGSDQGILDAFTAGDAAAAAKRAADARARAAKQARLTEQATAEAKRRGKAFTDAFKKRVRAQAEAGRERQKVFNEAVAADIARMNETAQTARKNRLQHEALVKSNRAEATVLGLQNAVGEAELIQNPERRLAAERKADQVLVKYYEGVVKRLKKQKAGILAIRQAEADVITAKQALQSLTRAASTGGGFTLAQLFAEAGSELQQYGSNIGAGPLSGQDAIHVYKSIVRTDEPTTQAIVSMARSTKPAPPPMAVAVVAGLSARGLLSARGKQLPIVERLLKQYPGLARYISLFAFKQSGPSPKGYYSESYQRGQSDSFDPSKLGIELFGNKNKPADVAGEIVSHFLARGTDKRLTSLYKRFTKTITPDQLKWLQRDYMSEGGAKSGRSFSAYEQASGFPALFRGSLFNQLWPDEVSYSPEQKAIFHAVDSVIKKPPSQTTVHQHFYGSRPTGQALADARAVARNSK